MSYEELKAFEMWLLECYRANSTVPFATLAKALKVVRENVR